MTFLSSGEEVYGGDVCGRHRGMGRGQGTWERHVIVSGRLLWGAEAVRQGCIVKPSDGSVTILNAIKTKVETFVQNYMMFDRW